MQNATNLSRDAVRRKLLIDLIAMLTIGLVAIVGYKLSPLISPAAETRLAPDPGCNLHRGSCSVSVAGGRLELSLSPQPVPLIKPIRIEVRTRGISLRRIDADFAGIGMNMGFNRPQLLPQGSNVHVGEATLPVCITGTMRWELTLLLETGSGLFSIPFRFDTPEGAAR
jgi:hypothetical protein